MKAAPSVVYLHQARPSNKCSCNIDQELAGAHMESLMLSSQVPSSHSEPLVTLIFTHQWQDTDLETSVIT